MIEKLISKRYILIFTLFLCTIIIFGCESLGPTVSENFEKEAVVQKVKMYELGPHEKSYSMYRIFNRKNSFFSIRNNDRKIYFLRDGNRFGPYQEVNQFEMTRDKKNWGVSVKRDGKYYVIINGKEHGPYSQGNNPALLYFDTSPDGKHLCVSVSPLFQAFYLIDGKKYHSYGNPRIYYSSDSSKWFIKARYGKKESVISNHKKIATYDSIYKLTISKDGSHWGAIATERGKKYIVISGKRYGPYPECSSLMINKTGSYWSAIIERGKRKILIVNGRQYKDYSSVDDWHNIRHSPDGSTWAIKTYKGDKQFLLVNGREYGPYQIIFEDKVLYGPGGNTWGIPVMKGGKAYILINGKEHGPYDTAKKLHLHSESRFAFTYSREGRHYAIIDGIEYGPYDGIYNLEVFYGANTDWSFAGKKGNLYMIHFNGKDYGPFSEDTSHRFSKNRKHFWICTRINNAYSLIVDGKKYGPYDSYCNIQFNNKNDWGVIVEKDNKKTLLINGEKKLSGDDLYNFEFMPHGKGWTMNKGSFTSNQHIIYNGKQKAIVDEILQKKYVKEKDGYYLYWHTEKGTMLYLNRVKIY